MSLLPNYQNAVVQNDKIYSYCLNINHERGRHKARVFKQALGITVKDAELLKNSILDNLKNFKVTNKVENIFGTLFTIPRTITILIKQQLLQQLGSSKTIQTFLH